MASWWDSASSGWGNYWSSGDGWAAAASALLGGISSSSAARQSREDREADARTRRELMEMQLRGQEAGIRMQGDESRRTIDFESRLNEANRLNERARMSQAHDAWASGTKPAAKPVTAPRFQDYYVQPTPYTPPKG
jgi:hypothetical protein